MTTRAKAPALLILAAGMGSRFGGLKQVEPVGPHGETIMDYSMHDALAAGFGSVVFVIRRQFEAAFRERVGRKLEGRARTAYVFQELDALPAGFALPPGREKPWGTGHAIMMGASAIDGSFAVINADDYYGPGAYRVLHDWLAGPVPASGPSEYAMVGYVLRQTLSEEGHVSRGICRADARGFLQSVTETTHIVKRGAAAATLDPAGKETPLSGDEVASMNLWGFRRDVFAGLEAQFREFLRNRSGDLKSEFYIPSAVDEMIRKGQARVRVLNTTERWFGVTYREDLALVRQAVAGLIRKGAYPERLWA